MSCEDPLAAGYTISRFNPAFRDETPATSSATPPHATSHPPSGDGRQTRLSSGYDSRDSRDSRDSSEMSRSSSVMSHQSSGPVERQDDPKCVGSAQTLHQIRQLSETVAKSPTLLAVCRALEAEADTYSGAKDRVDHGRICHTTVWTQYLGSGIVPGDITLKAKGYEQVLDLTLDDESAARLVLLVEHGTRQRCCCRALTAILAASVFVAAIVCVSLVVSRGQRVFGAL